MNEEETQRGCGQIAKEEKIKKRKDHQM